MWEVFDPKDGIPKFRTRFVVFAYILARVFKLDYEREGKGW